MKNKNKYIENKESNEYDLVTSEFNNHYGYDLTSMEHRCFGTVDETISHFNAVNEGSFLKKR
jgi:Rps23 Pro-64 3,4-dihydroxylase Tpa1-like proline 4-hydroxylase